MKISGGVVAALESDFLQGEIWTVFQKAAGLFHAKAGEILHHSRAGFFLENIAYKLYNLKSEDVCGLLKLNTSLNGLTA